ncbi:hypothetical protein OBBRIDRAFT_622962 [Obba rivulosa]|uniref:Uncharacterized protein n=1 Tax=Obba rivulosa TaxID=1052685 RepID=A0A8E2AVX6_9APHY|nr:hypothetical protein OBBRIDRAFT_622962 [Obba rivulosa]
MTKGFCLPWRCKVPSRRKAVGHGSMSVSDPSKLDAISRTATSAQPASQADDLEESPISTSTLTLEAPLNNFSWLVLIDALRTLGDVCDTSLSLKWCLVGVVAMMETVDIVADSRDGFLEIAHKVEGFQVVLSLHVAKHGIPPVIETRLGRLSE